jgi:general stress protein 26
MDDIRKLDEMIHGISVAMLVTVDADGHIRSRPMATLDTRFDGTLWFFTLRNAPKVEEIRNERRVNVSLADPQRDRYISFSGSARIVRDVARAREVWSPHLTAWFPGGLEDRDLALLAIDVEAAEYWDATENAMVRTVMGTLLVPRPSARHGESPHVP